MLALLNQFSTLTLAIGGFVLFAVNVVFCKWFLGKMQSEPADEPDEEEEEDVVAPAGLMTEPAIRTAAGVPRSRPIQPVTPPVSATSGGPIRLTSLADPSLAKDSDYAPIMEASGSKADSPSAGEGAPKPAPGGTSGPIDLLGSASKPGDGLSATGMTPTAFSSTPPGPAPLPLAPGVVSSPISLTRVPAAASPPTASLTALPAGVAKPEESAVKAAESAPLPSAASAGETSPPFSSPEKIKALEPFAEAPPILPPLNFTKRGSAIDRPSIAPILGGNRPASADLIMTPKIPAASTTSPAAAPATKPAETPPASVLSPFAGSAPQPAADLISVDKPIAPLASVTTDKKELPIEPASGNPDALAKEMSILNPTEPAKPAGADLIAMPAGGSADKPTETAAAETKKEAEKPVVAAGKSPTVEVPSEPGGGGLMLIPSSPAASPVVPQEETPAPIGGTPAPTSWKTRLLGRPRIFLPTTPGASAAPAATPEPAEPAAPSKSDPVSAKVEEPVKVEQTDKTDELKSAVAAVPKKPGSDQADITAPTASLSEVKPTSADKSHKAPAGSLVLSPNEGNLAKSAGTPAETGKAADAPKSRNIFLAPERSASPATALAKTEDADAKHAQPVAAAAAETPAADKPSIDLAPPAEVVKDSELASPSLAPADPGSLPAEGKATSEPVKPTAAATPEPVEAEAPVLALPVTKPQVAVASSDAIPPTPEPAVDSKALEAPAPSASDSTADAKSDLILPVASSAAPVTASKPPEEAAAASKPPARSFEPVSARPVEPVMNQEKSPIAAAAGGRASAQITLGFEITSLQLTPFFKLGAVQLRSLSNVVSLHLIASQAAENPLAAGISFQIDSVDLDESSHIKSILLKPLGQSQALTAPQPKLQVENVKIGSGAEGAIEVTSSQQTSTAVQMLATCTIAAMDFTPSFEIGSLRLEPNSNSVMLRLAPSSRPAALDLPPSFEVATVQLEGNAQLANVRLVPSTAK